MQMSINRALNELKMLTSRITDSTARLKVAEVLPVRFAEDQKTANWKASAAGEIQSVRDLIKRRQQIKSAIVISNATTEVRINDETMTVAAAIEYKTSIALDKALAMHLRQKFYTAKSNLDRHNAQAQANADAGAQKALNVQSEKDKGEEYRNMSDSIYKTNSAVLLAPDGLETLIDEYSNNLAKFEDEINFALSESNIRTMIEIPD